jgi:hypothetical protein
MGKTVGEMKQGKETIPRGHQKRAMKPPPFSEKRQRYGPPSVGGTNSSSFERPPPDGGNSDADALSSFSFRDVRRAIDEPQDGMDETLLLEQLRSGLFGECYKEDSTTPSLMNVGVDDEEDDDDDANALENLSECIGSLTSDETDAMIKAFDLYVQQKHHHDTNPKTHCPDDNLVFTDSYSSSNDDSHLFFADRGTTQTAEAPWSLKKWLLCRSTSASVDGIHMNNRFEPDTYTLDGIRKELFGEE